MTIPTGTTSTTTCSLLVWSHTRSATNAASSLTATTATYSGAQDLTCVCYLCLLPVSVTCVCYLCLLPVSATLNELQTHCQCTQKNVQVSIVNLNSYLTSAVRKIGVLHFPIMRWCCIGFRPHLLCFCST